jgi:hypothetical protein
MCACALFYSISFCLLKDGVSQDVANVMVTTTTTIGIVIVIITFNQHKTQRTRVATTTTRFVVGE